MKTQRKGTSIGDGLPRSAFEDDGIPNSPFKSSRSAAFTIAMFGIALGGLFVVCGAVMAFSHAQKSAPTQIVQTLKPAEPVAVAVAESAPKRYVNPARKAGKHKWHAKSKQVAHAK